MRWRRWSAGRMQHAHATLKRERRAQHSTAQRSTAQRSTAQHSTPTCRLMMAREPPVLSVRRGRLAAGMICRLVPRQMLKSCRCDGRLDKGDKDADWAQVCRMFVQPSTAFERAKLQRVTPAVNSRLHRRAARSPPVHLPAAHPPCIARWWVGAQSGTPLSQQCKATQTAFKGSTLEDSKTHNQPPRSQAHKHIYAHQSRI